MLALQDIFINRTRGRKIITDEIKTIPIDMSFNNMNWENLLSYHPQIQINSDNIEHLIVKNVNNKSYNSLYYKNRNIDGELLVSYVICLEGLFETFDADKHNEILIINAMRSSIGNENTARWYFKKNNEHNKICELCSATTNIEIDHYGKCFKEILDTFLENNNINFNSIDVMGHKLIDNGLEKKWVDYHDNIVSYRYLCKSCNCSIGTSGYKTKKKNNNN